MILQIILYTSLFRDTLHNLFTASQLTQETYYYLQLDAISCCWFSSAHFICALVFTSAMLV